MKQILFLGLKENETNSKDQIHSVHLKFFYFLIDLLNLNLNKDFWKGRNKLKTYFQNCEKIFSLLSNYFQFIERFSCKIVSH